MSKPSTAVGIEINPKLVGALFTDKVGYTLRVFCYFMNGHTSQFDVPDEDNRDSLRSLLSKLSMEETCTSVILDEVVQGRVFVQTGDQRWLYTVLRSPGQISPAFNADIADLPWQVCWRSQEAEVLRYNQPESQERCIAIRTRISENDASRLVKTSKAFTRPVSLRRSQPRGQSNLCLGAALLALGVMMAATLFFTIKQGRGTAVSLPTPAVAPAKFVPTAGGVGYCLLYNHKISGPYPPKVVADMYAAGLLNDETMCRPENSMEWGKISTIFPQVAQK